MIKAAIAKLADRGNLPEKEAEEVMLEIMAGEATPAQIAAYLMALRMKGETVEEIAGSARAMRSRATRIQAGDQQLVDTCGTGGDRANTFNISTTAAFVVAGAGLTVAKHGNRSVSSQSGSADVLKALGVRIDLPAEQVTVYHKTMLRAQMHQHLCQQFGEGFIVHPEHLDRRPRGLRQGAKDIQEGPDAHLLAGRRAMLHRTVEQRRKEKTNADLVEALGHLLCGGSHPGSDRGLPADRLLDPCSHVRSAGSERGTR